MTAALKEGYIAVANTPYSKHTGGCDILNSQIIDTCQNSYHLNMLFYQFFFFKTDPFWHIGRYQP